MGEVLLAKGLNSKSKIVICRRRLPLFREKPQSAGPSTERMTTYLAATDLLKIGFGAPN